MLFVSVLLVGLAAASAVFGALVNVTVDDSGSDPRTGYPFSYSPQADWNIGQDCPGCVAQPNPTQAFMGTWHDATYNGINGSWPELETATLAFTGE